MTHPRTPQGFETHDSRSSRVIQHPFAGFAGLLFPGGGQLVRRDPISAILVLLGTVVPLLWCAALCVRLINTQVQFKLKEARLTVLDSDWFHKLSDVPSIPPELIALALLGITIHLYGAWAAASGSSTTRAMRP